MRSRSLLPLLLLLFPFAGPAALASSHREAPGITETPKVDATDFYLFRSYEAGRDGYVSLVANYLPLQDAYGGPNYFALDPDALYDIKIDNNGDAREDLTFRFRFTVKDRNIALAVGPPGSERQVAVPLVNVGPITAADTSALNRVESYTVQLVRGAQPPARAQGELLRDAHTNATTFEKPVDFIGFKSLPDYEGYAAGDAAPEHLDPTPAGGPAEQPRGPRGRPRRVPERPASGRRRRGHRAACRHGRAAPRRRRSFRPAPLHGRRERGRFLHRRHVPLSAHATPGLPFGGGGGRPPLRPGRSILPGRVGVAPARSGPFPASPSWPPACSFHEHARRDVFPLHPRPVARGEA